MINVDRSKITAPRITGSAYRTKGVKKALGSIFLNKCYLCEIYYKNPDKFDVDHYRPKSVDKHLKVCWENLYLICHDCNMSKNDFSKDILDPCKNDVESMIEYELGHEGDELFFFATDSSCDISLNTIDLLHRMHMGSIRTQLKTACLRDSIRNQAFRLARNINKLKNAVKDSNEKEISRAEQIIRIIVSRSAPFTMFMRSVAKEFLGSEAIKYYD